MRKQEICWPKMVNLTWFKHQNWWVSPTIIGVDDVNYHKGRTYFSERRNVIWGARGTRVGAVEAGLDRDRFHLCLKRVPCLAASWCLHVCDPKGCRYSNAYLNMSIYIYWYTVYIYIYVYIYIHILGSYTVLIVGLCLVLITCGKAWFERILEAQGGGLGSWSRWFLRIVFHPLWSIPSGNLMGF